MAEKERRSSHPNRPFVVALLVAASAAGCSKESEHRRADALEDFKLVLRRDLSPGSPDYAASVDGAGTVSFQSPGCNENAPGWTVPLATVEELRSRLRAIDFFAISQGDVNRECVKEVAHLPVVSLEAWDHGRLYRRVDVDDGCKATPLVVKLRELSRAIDTALGTAEAASKPSMQCEGSAERGRVTFEKQGCDSCHNRPTDSIGGDLRGLFGKTVTLADGGTIVADRAYVEESILDPMTKIVKGYKPSMPAFRGKLRRQQLRDLTAYLKQRSERVDAGR